MNGVVFQTSTMITAASAVSGEAVQAIGWSIRRRACRMTLMIPNTSLNIHDHICAETTVGIAHGISTAARRMPRPPKWALSASAMPRPRMVSMMIEMSANTSVLRTGVPPVRVGQEVGEVVDADELRRAQVGEVGVGEGEPDRAQQRPARHSRQHQDHRRHEQPGRPGPLPGQPRRTPRTRCNGPATAATSLAAMAASLARGPVALAVPPTTCRRATAGRASCSGRRGWPAPRTGRSAPRARR